MPLVIVCSPAKGFESDHSMYSSTLPTLIIITTLPWCWCPFLVCPFYLNISATFILCFFHINRKRYMNISSAQAYWSKLISLLSFFPFSIQSFSPKLRWKQNSASGRNYIITKYSQRILLDYAWAWFRKLWDWGLIVIQRLVTHIIRPTTLINPH